MPSESEWEKAARGTDGRVYPWGDTFDQARCNTTESGIGTTTAVGSYPNGASLYHVQDMAGNVWERTSSLFWPYPYRNNDGRENLKSTASRVLRGGSWAVGASFARAAHRGYGLSSDEYEGDFFGFRLALDLAGS